MSDLDVMIAEHDASERIAFCMESGLGFGHSSVAAALARVETARANNRLRKLMAAISREWFTADRDALLRWADDGGAQP